MIKFYFLILEIKSKSGKLTVTVYRITDKGERVFKQLVIIAVEQQEINQLIATLICRIAGIVKRKFKCFVVSNVI